MGMLHNYLVRGDFLKNVKNAVVQQQKKDLVLLNSDT